MSATLHHSTEQSTESKQIFRVDLGEQRLVQNGEKLSLVLGSCVGLCLWDYETQTGAVAHIMLPYSQGLNTAPERFADKAVGLLLDRFRQLDIPLTRLEANLVGGARLAESTTGFGIGHEIVGVVAALLEEESVAISSDRTGGNYGCRAELDCSTGILTVDSVIDQREIA
ncbi:MAG: chemotaxis protein CheD [Pirellulaceae bacterium]|jgi:chemotaxis protein CheD